MWKIVVFLYLLTLGHSAFANTVVTCGGNEGYAFYFAGLIVKSEDAGWHTDGTSSGKTALTLNGEKIDILFSDATGNLQSATASGGIVALLGNEGSWITVLVNYPNTTAELYTFNLETKSFAMSSHKYGSAPIQKAATFVGKCL
tara:strand:+ start:919 stop:1350 length:432 start_codon:yes stop_codon:yes gene_type:complete